MTAKFCRDNRNGGSCIFVYNQHKYKLLNDINVLSVKNIFECSAIELIEHNIIVLCVYRSPKNRLIDVDAFFTKLEDALTKICFKNKKIVLCGDFNIDRLNVTPMSRQFEQLLASFNLKLGLNQPTRLSSNTCLDNFAYNFNKCKVSITEFGLSDHTAQVLKCPVKKSSYLTHFFRWKRDYGEDNINKFVECLKSLSFCDVYNALDSDVAYNTFFDTFKLFYDLCFPVLKVKISVQKRPKWLSKGIKLCSNRKRSLLWKYRHLSNEHNKNTFKQYSKRLKAVIKQTQRAQNNYHIAQSTNKAKATWDTINKYKQFNIKDEIVQINTDSEKITDPKKIAQCFNNFFIDDIKGSKLNNSNSAIKINHSQLNSCFMTPTDTYEIMNIITSLKNTNSTGYDEICTKIVKSSSKLISPVLSHIINKSIENGIFPTKLKTTIISPLYKKQDKEDVRSYRPIALIPVFSKIVEKVIYNCLNNYFEKNNIFATEQSGFRKNKSIDMAILNFLETIIKGLDKKKRVTALYMDMTKAFDHVEHTTLMQKLEMYGVRGTAHDLIKSYLSNRNQRTEIKRIDINTKIEEKYSSDCRTVKYGVPQGSILGPLLFLIYINDLPNTIRHPMVLFADDSTAIFTDDNTIEHENDINNSLIAIMDWLNINNLKMNLDKTHIMTFKNKNSKFNKLNILYNGKKIKEIESTKFLGVEIDSSLSWKPHIDNICTKLNKFSYALYKLRNVTDQRTLLTAYHAYVGSTLRYGVLFWANSTNKEMAFKAQKKCIRSICTLKQTDSCKKHFQELKLLTLPSIYIYEAALLVKRNIDKYDTLNLKRHKSTLRAPVCKTAMYSKSLFNMRIKIYNKLPQSIKDICSFNIFKNNLKEFLINKAYYNIGEFIDDIELK